MAIQISAQNMATFITVGVGNLNSTIGRIHFFKFPCISVYCVLLCYHTHKTYLSKRSDSSAITNSLRGLHVAILKQSCRRVKVYDYTLYDTITVRKAAMLVSLTILDMFFSP